MGCSDIQEKLSAYMEDIISSEEKVLIDGHLKVCQKCNGSLADLRKIREYMQNLEEVEPPPWLTGKVMASVKSEVAPKREIFQRLFYPLHIKLPIEALATIFVAVATIYVFKTIQPEMERAKVPPAEITSRMLFQEKEKTSALDEGKPLPAKPTEEFMHAEERKISPGKFQQLPKASARVAKRDEVEPPAGAIGKREYERKALSPEMKMALVERKRKGVGLTINVRDIEVARKEIKKTVTQLGGKIIETEDFEQRNVIFAELDSKKINELFEKLKLIGEVRERALPSEARKGTIEVRMEITENQ
ncbi:MAG: DUF2275 domain-containing protein [Candidatus Zixiibacteriota bacterium]